MSGELARRISSAPTPSPAATTTPAVPSLQEDRGRSELRREEAGEKRRRLPPAGDHAAQHGRAGARRAELARDARLLGPQDGEEKDRDEQRGGDDEPRERRERAVRVREEDV